MTTYVAAQYAAGAGTTLVGPDWLALIDAPADADVTTRLAALLHSQADFQHLAALLIELGLSDLPPLAVASLGEHSHDSLRVLLHGDITCSIVTVDGHSETWTAAGLKTWLECHANGVLEIRLATSSTEPATASFTTAEGSAPASTVNRRLELALAPARQTPDLPEQTATVTDNPPVAPALEVKEAQASDTDGATPTEGKANVASAALSKTEDSEAVAASSTPQHAWTEAARALPVPDGSREQPLDATSEALDDPYFDHMLGHTIFRGVEQAAVRADDDVSPDTPNESAGSSPTTPAAGPIATFCEECGAARIGEDKFCQSCGTRFRLPEPASTNGDADQSSVTRIFDPEELNRGPGAIAPQALAPRPAPPTAQAINLPPPPQQLPSPPRTPFPGPAAGTGAAGIIGAVPGMPALPAPPTAQAANPAPPASAAPGGYPVTSAEGAPSAPERASDGLDDSPTTNVAAVRGMIAGQATPAGPPVQAVHCPNRHPNPPHADTCRNCGQPISDRSVSVVARPSLGILRSTDGQVYQLDQPLILGRKPGDRPSVMGEEARGVALRDPDKQLSRVHAEVRLIDWQVQIVDRESTNHTYVQLPGQVQAQLRPAEPWPIPPGTVINLGDSVSLTYEVPPA